MCEAEQPRKIQRIIILHTDLFLLCCVQNLKSKIQTKRTQHMTMHVERNKHTSNDLAQQQ